MLSDSAPESVSLFSNFGSLSPAEGLVDSEPGFFIRMAKRPGQVAGSFSSSSVTTTWALPLIVAGQLNETAPGSGGLPFESETLFRHLYLVVVVNDKVIGCAIVSARRSSLYHRSALLKWLLCCQGDGHFLTFLHRRREECAFAMLDVAGNNSRFRNVASTCKIAAQFCVELLRRRACARFPFGANLEGVSGGFGFFIEFSFIAIPAVVICGRGDAT